jgi:hypothetical protein
MGFDPITIGLVTSAGAALAGGISQYQAGQSQADALRNQAQLARQSAALDAFRKRREGAAIIAKERAGMAAGGIIPDVGTGLVVQETTARNIEFDAQLIKWGGATRAMSLEYGAESAEYGGESALIGSVATAAGRSLLSGKPTVGKTGLGLLGEHEEGYP